MEKHICFTPAQDELLSLGWPRSVRLVDSHPDDRRPASSARAYFSSARSYASEWPREVAYRVLRNGYGAAAPGPVTASEAKQILTRTLTSPNGELLHGEHGGADVVYIAERILGADETLETIASGFERLEMKGDPWPALVSYPSTLAFLMLRASPDVRAKIRPRLQVQRDCAARAGWDACVRNFDLSLRGSAAVKEALVKRRGPDLFILDYAGDDPELVRTVVARHPFLKMSVRAVKIGGLETAAGLARRCLRAFPPSSFPQLLRDFGMVKSPETVDLALSLVGRTHVKDAPIRWLVAHAKYAKPLVEESARHGSPIARTVMRKLADAW